jgi:hypothetical protein
MYMYMCMRTCNTIKLGHKDVHELDNDHTQQILFIICHSVKTKLI